MKIQIILLTLVALLAPAIADVIATTTVTASTTTASADKTCNIDLLNNYGLRGMATAQEIPLKMCPDVQYSCCNESDQMEIYYNWLGSGAKEFIATYYDDLQDSYSDLFDNLQDVHNFAKRIVRLLEDKPVSNCKILAQVLDKFKVSEVSESVNKNLQKMETFFVESYQGFYCALCNQDNHKYISATTLTITLSTKFARDVITNTLPTLLFFYDDMNTYLNTISRFLESCDFKGTYKYINDISPQNRFTPNKAIVRALNECSINRNKPQWLTSCAIVSQNFSLTKINEFFEPKRKEFLVYNQFIKNTLARNALMDTTANKTVKSRILEAVPATTDSSTPASPLSVANGPDVFIANDPTKINLSTFNITFADMGISLQNEGQNSLINHQLFVETKAKIEYQNSNNSSSRALKLLKKAKSAAKSFWSFFI